MFWKRKGKKKDGDEAGAAGAAVTTESADTDDERAEPTAEDGTGAAEAADGKAGAAEAAEDAAGAEKSKAADDAADAAEDTGAKAAPGGTAGDKAEDKAENTTADKADGKADAEDGGSAADEAAETDDADDADDAEDADSEDDGGNKKAARPVGLFADAGAGEPGVTGPDDEGVRRVRTAGVLKAEGEEYDVVSNTWIVDADDEGVIVIDPAHDAKAILDAVGDREVYLVACTNGYNTHIGAAIEVAERDEAPIALHRRELRAWRREHGAEHRPDMEVEGGGSFKVGDLEVDVLPIPGTANGSVAYYISERGIVFTGDSLRAGELGTVGDGYIDYTQQLHSIGEIILSLPPDTRVLPDSGPETTVEAESRNFDSWVSTA
ncbi:MBL fold metallo-hydrolase [Streptomonospora nanhaiensis]|uniref:MBL fold metallo-hydrolase n=1 Tax=Streptomonospora nanhaiensis TaxID=1323731 RepID=UPI001C3805A6|nr:MBL fold metallo-hydrolase [Streptomonospora nanhaiensis]MBV2362754.1 MBL fold metallo-hydrolase [Streptomonospora nanhaiensis]MBX9389787.1 MBL fold metallo-hydrolase [Streptomonospora nanhaiensis]